MNRYKVTVEYDGTPFHGWQRQEGANSVQQHLEESILPITRAPVTFFGAGRTDTGVHALAQVAHFDARFSAKERFYLYKILNRRANACLDLNRVWKVTPPLDAEKMNKVAQNLVGRHDFSSFRAAGCQANSPVKTLNSISVTREDEKIFVRVTAKSFLYHQVRNIVGSLYMVGCGKWSEEDFVRVFEAKDRTKAGQTAPACGLYFVGVRYK